MSKEKNKDVLKLLKSWGICDQYVSGVSIAASVDDLRTVKVNVEYCLPRGGDWTGDEQCECRPKFKVGTCITFPWCNYYVEAVLVDKEGAISYRIRRSYCESSIDEISVTSEQGLAELIAYSKGKRLKTDSTESRVGGDRRW